MADPSFVEWILQPTPQTVVYWRRWQEEHLDQQDILEEARRTVLLLHFKETNFSQRDATDLQDRISATISQDGATKSQRQVPLRYPVAVATVLLLLTAAWLWLSNRPVVYGACRSARRRSARN